MFSINPLNSQVLNSARNDFARLIGFCTSGEHDFLLPRQAVKTTGNNTSLEDYEKLVQKLELYLIGNAAENSPRHWLWEDLVSLVDTTHRAIRGHKENISRQEVDRKPFNDEEDCMVLEILPLSSLDRPEHSDLPQLTAMDVLTLAASFEDPSFPATGNSQGTSTAEASTSAFPSPDLITAKNPVLPLPVTEGQQCNNDLDWDLNFDSFSNF
jgi:hypothetical protein